MSTPKLISVDGPLASGKTPFVQRLAQAIRERKGSVVTTTALSETPLGAFLRTGQFEMCGLPLALVAAADRQLQMDTIVLPALHDRVHTVVDRYVPTAIALDGLAAGIGPANIHRLYEHMPIPGISYLVLAPLDYRVERLRAKQIVDDYEAWFTRFEDEESHYRRAADFLATLGWRFEIIEQPMERLTEDDIANLLSDTD